MSFREEAIRNGYTEAYTDWAIEKARTRIKNEKVPTTLEGLRKILSEEITAVLTERTPEVTKPELSATASGWFLSTLTDDFRGGGYLTLPCG